MRTLNGHTSIHTHNNNNNSNIDPASNTEVQVSGGWRYHELTVAERR